MLNPAIISTARLVLPPASEEPVPVLTPTFDVGSANTLGSASTTATTTTITTAQDGELLVACACIPSANSPTGFYAATGATTESGAGSDIVQNPLSNAWLHRHALTTTTGADVGSSMADAIKAGAGATGTVQSTSAASHRHAMAVAAFKPPDGKAWTEFVGRMTGAAVASGDYAFSGIFESRYGAGYTDFSPNDLLVGYLGFRDSVDFTLPAGWTVVATRQLSGNAIAGAGAIASLIMFWGVMGESQPNYTFTRSGGDVCRGLITGYRAA